MRAARRRHARRPRRISAWVVCRPRAQVPAAPLRRDGRAGTRGAGAEQRAGAAAACTMPTCSPARAASARPRSSRILAKSLNCTGPDGTRRHHRRSPAACARPAPRSMPTATSTTSSSTRPNRGIDEIRDLIERAAYKPSVGRFKVFMIDEAHQLTKDAFNALLKTLEEPPEYLKFVLATTDPDKMLPTVLSRCLQFNLRPMAPQTVQEHLQHVLAAEQRGSTTPARCACCRAPRAARCATRLSLTDQAIAYGGGRLQEAGGARDAGQRRPRRVRPASCRRWPRATAPPCWPASTRLRERGPVGGRHARRDGHAAAADGGRAGRAGRARRRRSRHAGGARLAALLQPDETQLLYSIALHGRAELQLLSDEYAALTMVLLRFLAFPSSGAAPAPGLGVARRARRTAAPLRPAVTASAAPATVAGARAVTAGRQRRAAAMGRRAAAPTKRPCSRSRPPCAARRLLCAPRRRCSPPNSATAGPRWCSRWCSAA